MQPVNALFSWHRTMLGQLRVLRALEQ